jgi:hypothetical protein
MKIVLSGILFLFVIGSAGTLKAQDISCELLEALGNKGAESDQGQRVISLVGSNFSEALEKINDCLTESPRGGLGGFAAGALRTVAGGGDRTENLEAAKQLLQTRSELAAASNANSGSNTRSRRSDPLSDLQRGFAEENQDLFNCFWETDDAKFSGSFRQTVGNTTYQYEGVLCLSDNVFVEYESRQIALLGRTLPVNIGDMGDCRLINANHLISVDDLIDEFTGHPQNLDPEARIGASFELACAVGDRMLQYKGQATRTGFYIDSMAVTLCGPESNASGSAWENRIFDRYPMTNDGGNNANIYNGGTVVVDVDSGRDLEETIDVRNVGNTRYTRYFPSCDSNESYWQFRVSEPSQNYSIVRMFKDALIAEQDARRSSGDDF